MTPRKPSKKQQRAHLTAEIRKRYTEHFDLYPGAARQAALALCGLLCKRMVLEDLQNWHLALTIKSECPSFMAALKQLDAQSDDPS